MNGKYYGYHRTSTKEQHLDRGISEINTYCKNNNIIIEKIFTDQQTGKNFNRPRYQVMKEDVLRTGDTLIITEIDRLGRNKQDTMKELSYFKEKGIRIMVLELPTTLIDLSAMDNSVSAMMLECINNMMLELYTSMAQAEINKKDKRQAEGITAKKARGEWSDYGRPRKMEFKDFCIAYKNILDQTLRPVDFMRKYNISPSAYYRYKKEYETKFPNSQ